MQLARVIVLGTAGLAVLALACGSTDESRIVVASESGQATLTFDRDALPEGVSAGDISVQNSTTTLEAGDGVLAVEVFELLPHGLELRSPVRLTITVPAGDRDAVLSALHVADQQVELVPVEIVSLDAASGTVTASVELSRFSFLYTWYHETVFEISAKTSRSEVPVGESFRATFTVTQTVFPSGPTGGLLNTLMVDAGEFFEYIADAPWTVSGSITASGAISPTSVSDRPPPTGVSTGTFTINQQFTCTEAGTGRAANSVSVVYGVRSLYIAPNYGGLPSEGTPRTDSLRGTMPAVTCVAPAVDSSVYPPGSVGAGISRDNNPPLVAAIVAEANPPTTTYSVLASDPDGSPLTYTWSGTTCGTVSYSPDTGSVMAWHHGDESCAHTTVEHADATIVVLVSDGAWVFKCEYKGAGSGTGSTCFVPLPESD